MRRRGMTLTRLAGHHPSCGMRQSRNTMASTEGLGQMVSSCWACSALFCQRRSTAYAIAAALAQIRNMCEAQTCILVELLSASQLQH